MLKLEENSIAQAWELEVTCKNKKYLDEVVNAILKYGMINFEVEGVEFSPMQNNEFEGSYTVLMWCHWFGNLSKIAADLAEIEERQESFDNNGK